jgi:hypothetical protein
MSRRLYPHRRIKYWYVYDIDDICIVFSDLGLHDQTVRKWITQGGLKTIDGGKPKLIYGNDLIIYLKAQNSKGKCKTAFDQFYCMKCQDACPVFQNLVFVKQGTQVLHVQARCRVCKGKMFKNYSLDVLSDIRVIFKLVDVSELYDCSDPSVKTHIEASTQSTVNESGQLSLL